MAEYAIYSCEGFGREILPSARHEFSVGDHDDIVFVDDDPERLGNVIHGCKVISFEELQNDRNKSRQVSVSVADPWMRGKIVDKCRDAGLSFFSITDSTHMRFDNVNVGEGAVFCAFTVATGDSQIGQHFHCNIYSYVAHDCKIGDFVTFAPRVCCNGRVEIDDFVYVGTGAFLRQGEHDRPLRIGRGAVVGMGAVVIRDVPAHAVVAGNPAKVIRLQEVT